MEEYYGKRWNSSKSGGQYLAPTTTSDKSIKAEAEMNFDDSLIKLSVKFFRVLDKHSNQLCSPIGLHQLLSAMCTMCENAPESQEKLLSILGMKLSENVLYQLNGDWFDYLNLLNVKYNDKKIDKLKMYLGMFSRLPIDVNSNLGSVLKVDYHGHLVDCNDVIDCVDPILVGEKLSSMLDNWVAKCTDGIMGNLKIDFNSGDVKSVLLSIVNFESKWDTLLNWKVEPGCPFFVDDDTKVNADFISARTVLDYYEDVESDVKIVKLPYENSAYCLMIFLPGNLDNFENKLLGEAGGKEEISTGYFRNVEKQMNYTKVEVRLPRFKIENEIDVTEKLEEAFGGGVLPTGNSTHGLFAETVKQINYIEVNELHTKAVSVTSTVCVDGPAKQYEKFSADKPFLFMLCHYSKPIFMGRLYNPI